MKSQNGNREHIAEQFLDGAVLDEMSELVKKAFLAGWDAREAEFVNENFEGNMNRIVEALFPGFPTGDPVSWEDFFGSVRKYFGLFEESSDPPSIEEWMEPFTQEYKIIRIEEGC
jgi:hypothetical protein